MHKILVVENDLNLLKTLGCLFDQKNHDSYTASNIKSAIDILAKQKIDLLVVDRVLDDGDGIDLIKHVNENSYHTKVLVLSNKGSVREKIWGLESGADDYLAKPFSYSELILRVNSLLAKEKLENNHWIKLGVVSISQSGGEIKIGDKRKVMRKKEFEILKCLAKHKNQVVNKDTIINSVWDLDGFLPTYTTLDVYIRRIRVALENQKDIIKTVRGYGYMLSI